MISDLQQAFVSEANQVYSLSRRTKNSFMRTQANNIWWHCKIYSLSSRQTPVQSHSSHQQSQPHQISPTSFLLPFSWSCFHLLHALSRALLSGDQEDHSCSSEARQNHQKLNSFTPFPSFTAYFTNSIPPIIIHPKNMQFMERLAFFLLS